MSYFSHIFLAILMLVGVQTSLFAQTEFAKAMQDGQHVLFMRHADAPGFGDPQGYRLDQCSTQRNLGERGNKQAKATGDWLTKQGITKAQVYSSPWCRCFDTASLLNKGAVKKEAALGSFFDDMSQAQKQTEALTKLIQLERIQHPKTPIIMVTHHVNIESFTGQVLSSGDMILVKVDSSGRALSHTRYPNP